jgi:hypothetical protein
MVHREMLSWLKRYLPNLHEVVLEENPTADRTVLLIWFHQLCSLMPLSHKSRLICVHLEQTLCCSIQRLRRILLHLLREALLLEEKPLTFTIPQCMMCMYSTQHSSKSLLVA